MSAAGVPAADGRESAISWSAVIAGAAVAAGLSMTLLAFGAGIGLSVVSTAPTWRDSSPWLWLCSGIYLVFVALASFGFGGYVAGRMRLRAVVGAELEFRDGMNGIVMWGLAVLVTAVLAVAGAAVISRTAVPAGGSAPGSVAGETIIASELDELFRMPRRAPENDIAYRRAEAARILLKSQGRSGIGSEDRNYLAHLVGNYADIPDNDAAARTERVIGEAADEIHRARQAAVMQAFLVAAGLLLGAAVAWFAAVEGGRDRERGGHPIWDWTFRRRTA
ncbi:MAG: hypothetical protein KGJ78_10740 [Alphaproteobacteria bacterium]|nr:hypothetical protein [Alphaproteobacteria bacterium]